MARVHEYVHRATNGAFTVRAWCAAGPGFTADPGFQQALVENALDDHDTAEDIAEAVAGLEFCNAVEVCERGSDTGLLIYPDWP